jgi:hypothetical protein
LARAGRGARIGTRAARFARVIRLIRMIRIMKLYKSANFAMNQIDEEKLAASKNQVKPLQSEQSKAESASSPDYQES